MDPDQTLREIRPICEEIESEEHLDELGHLALELQEKVQNLDEWLSKGGHAPSDWLHGGGEVPEEAEYGPR